MKSFKSYIAAGAGFATLVTIIFLSTGWGSAVAASVSNVFVTNTSAHPVPVTPTGTLPVHEQGTADVNVTNTSALQVSDNTATQVLFDGTGVNIFHQITLNTSHSREIRVYVSKCDGDVRVVDSASGAELPVLDCSAGNDTELYEVPGPSITLWVEGTDALSAHLVVYGRSN
jgi:hypothetical protein